MIETAAGELPGAFSPVFAAPAISAPFRHGFTTRAGGVSPAPYDTLNLGRSWGDAPANVLENRRRVLAASGGHALYLVSQVHGARVVTIRGDEDPAALATVQADGLCTLAAGATLAVLVADCVPVVIADPRTGAVAAVHAGWRSTVGGILPAAVAALAALGARPEDLRVALGPAIGPCCFEVGAEVVEAFVQALPGGAPGVIVDRPGRKPHIDLRRAQRLMLAAAGVPVASVDATDACTRCDPAGRFYSFRRSGPKTGQHLGFVCRVPVPGTTAP